MSGYGVFTCRAGRAGRQAQPFSDGLRQVGMGSRGRQQGINVLAADVDAEHNTRIAPPRIACRRHRYRMRIPIGEVLAETTFWREELHMAGIEGDLEIRLQKAAGADP